MTPDAKTWNLPKPGVVAGVLLAVALLSLIPAAIYGRSAFFTNTAKTAETKPEEPAPPVVNPNRAEHVAYTLAGLIGAITALGIAGWNSMSRDVGSRTQVLKSLLAFGALYGGTVMLFGLSLFVLWFDSITKWLDGGETKEAYRVLIPIIVVVAGAALMFLGMQPARSEERNNPTIRRLIYGTNLGLSALLLFFALLVVNIVLALRLPARLDATESGFYSLADSTKKYLANLDQPVTAYSNFRASEGRFENDALRLLEACQDTNPSRFQVTQLSKAFSKDEFTRLKAKYPQYDLEGNSAWVLLTVGDEGRAAFIPLVDMLAVESDNPRGGGTRVFAGEGKLLREVLYLADNKTKPVVYLTQGHGELSLGTGTVGPPGHTANALKAILEKNYIEVRTWMPEAKDPKIPDDAIAVIVADPRSPFSTEDAAALAAYMTKDFADKRKGKLILLTSPFPNVDGKGVSDTGLEGLLLDYTVTLGKSYVVSIAQSRSDFSQILSRPSVSAIESGNSIAALIAGNGAFLTDCRTISVKPAGPEATMRPEVLLDSYPPGRTTWFDSDPPSDPAAQYKAIIQSRELIQKYRMTQNPVSLAATVSEGNTPRLVVIGSGATFADGSRGRSASPPVNIIAASLDWLRDRPTLAAITKPYTTYTLPKTADGFRIFWLPVGLVLLAITMAGLGVWTVRRK